jgi:hypothetical protein
MIVESEGLDGVLDCLGDFGVDKGVLDQFGGGEAEDWRYTEGTDSIEDAYDFDRDALACVAALSTG